ncbi:hypothetical protein PO909_028657 [Leuciscus waleckii]
MAVFYDLRLVSLAVLMLASQLDSASAAVRVFDLHAKGLTGDLVENFIDPYVKVWCGGSFGRTGYREDNNNPTWYVEFNFPYCNRDDKIRLELWDQDLIYGEHFGTCVGDLEYGTFSMYCELHGGKRGTLFFNYELKP